MDRVSQSTSTHASLRQLLELGLCKSSSAEPQKITRTVKLKVRTDGNFELHQTLNQHFNAVEKFRRTVLDELESWWDKKPDNFSDMVRASAKERYEDKSSCYGWLYTHFLSNVKLPAGLNREAANSVLWSLQGGLKSFLTRRENVAMELEEVYTANTRLWNEGITRIIRDHNLSEPTPPSPPPKLNFEKLAGEQIEEYNDWVGRVRMWGNLILHQQLVQKGLVDREDAKLPRRLKGYPGFPGSQRYGQAASLAESMERLNKIARRLAKDSTKRFAKISPEHWNAVLERFFPPETEASETRRRPRTIKQMTAERLHYLRTHNSDWKPDAISDEVLAGLFRLAGKLEKHLKHNSPHDRRAVIKLANVLNVAAVFSLEPLRAAGDYVACFEADEPRRKAFADVRGALTQPGDDTAAIEITGFSLSSNSPQYCGLLACREIKTDFDEWAFFYALGGQDLKIFAKPPAKPPRQYQPTNWRGFATQGKDDDKEIVRGTVWLPVENSKIKPALALPLCFGTRQGREYFWHFDRDLRTRSEWTPLNARLLRVMPQEKPQLGEFYVTITFQRLAPPVTDVATKKLVGVDRGEAVPASYAVVDAQGRFLANPKRLAEFSNYLSQLEGWEKQNLSLPECERNKSGKPAWKSQPEDGFGFIAPEYREQQREFNDKKRELQRTKGGYTRWLRAKERNRARALGGQVARDLLALSASHQAPLVFESLDSRLATRGGRGTMMRQMQYTRVFSSVTQKLAEAGLFDLKSKKWNNAFVHKVGPAYTSATCSSCGQVHSTPLYEKIAATLQESGQDWQVTLPNGESRQLPREYTYWVRGKGEQTANTDERIRELLNKPFAELSKTNHNALISLLKNRWLPFRPDQATFRCLACGHSINADIQGALNIARKHLFRVSRAKKAEEDSEAARRKVMGEWEAWYRQKLATVWHT
jgi:hypothetical protein